MAPANPARDQVLGISELLESILVHLDSLDLIRHQRVCRHWRSVISSAPSLQRRTFLLPAAHRSKYLSIYRDGHVTKDTMFQYLIQHMWIGIAISGTNYVLHPNYHLSGAPELHLRTESVYHYGSLQIPGPDIHWQGGEDASFRLSSWAQMLVCQPPCKRLCFEIRHPGKAHSAEVVNESGVTMGQLWEEVKEMAQHYPRVSKLSKRGVKWYFWKCKLSWKIEDWRIGPGDRTAAGEETRSFHVEVPERQVVIRTTKHKLKATIATVRDEEDGVGESMDVSPSVSIVNTIGTT